MAPFDPKIFRNLKDGIGMPSDDAATDHTQEWTVVALLKGIYNIFANIGVATSPAFTDDAAFTPGTTKTQPVAGTYRSTRDALDDSDAGTIALNQRRGVYVTLEATDSTPLALNAGAASAATLRAVLASDDPAVTSLAILDDWDETDRAKVNLIVGQAGIAAGAGAVGATVPRVTLASDDPGVVALQIIDDWDESDRAKVNLIVGQAGIAAGTGVDGASVPRVTLATNVGLPAGTALIGRAVADASAATGGIASTSRIVVAAASTNATSAKASTGRVYAVQGYNAATSVRYLKLYNKATAPVVGTDTPVKTIALPPQTGFALDWPHGYSFATGIAYALTTGATDADTGALSAADVLGLNIDYV